MKRWLTGVAAAAVLVAVWALPPSIVRVPSPNRLPEQERLQAVEREVRQLHGALRAFRWADSLSGYVLREQEGGLVLSPPRLREGSDPALLDTWEATERATLDALEPRDPDMVVGIVWVPAGHGTLPGVPLGGATREVTFVGEGRGRPYCIQAIPYHEPSARGLLRYAGYLEGCRLYAKYGMPGAHLQDWLRTSSLGFARTTDFEELAQLRSSTPRGTLRLFGINRPLLANGDLAVQACLAGRAEACERALTAPGSIAPRMGDDAWLVANSPATSLRGFAAQVPFGYVDDGLLYEWEAEFGPEAFTRFWRSAEPVPAAFEAAFDVPLGEWVLAWVQGHSSLYRPGPSLPLDALGWSLLTLALLGVVVTATASRRSVG